MGDRLGTPGAVGFWSFAGSFLVFCRAASLCSRVCDVGDTGPEVNGKSTGVQKIFSLFSKCALPPNQIRNPKTEHRVEIYLNISDYM